MLEGLSTQLNTVASVLPWNEGTQGSARLQHRAGLPGSSFTQRQLPAVGTVEKIGLNQIGLSAVPGVSFASSLTFL